MTPSWRTLCWALLVACMGAPGWSSPPVHVYWSGDVTAGLTTTFNCFSTCSPNCTYTWNLGGRKISGNSLSWTPDGEEAAVELQCSVYDPNTGTSSSTTVTVEVQNQMFVQISPENTVPSLSQPLSLVCQDMPSSDPRGPSDLVWFKDGQKVTLRENLKLLENRTALHFDSPLPSDAGFYHCQTYTLQTRVNSVGFLLSFDPWNVTISGPDVVYVEKLSEFTCLTSCNLNVECSVKWQFKGGFPVGTHFSVNKNRIKWVPSVPGTTQNFTCIAENKATGQSAQATKTVEVKDVPISGSETVRLGGLSALTFCSFVVFRAVSFFTEV